jgi:hypothetical protein
MPFQQQVLHPLQTLAVLKFIAGQALDQLRFNHGSISITNKRQWSLDNQEGQAVLAGS